MNEKIEIFRDALFLTKKHRLYLTRDWDCNLPKILFIGLNPSKADGKDDDPTIRRCISFARRWGYGGMVMMNLFLFVTPYPEELIGENAGMYQAINLNKMENIKCEDVVLAWGSFKILRQHESHIQRVIDLFPNAYCLGRNKDGNPKHPLFLKSTTKLTLFNK